MTFLDLLDELHVEYRRSGHEHCRYGWLQIDCHRCSPGWKHFRLGYNLSGRYLSCWNCGRVSLWDTVQALTGWPRRRVAAFLGELPRERAPVAPDRGVVRLPAGLGPLLGAHRRYLRGRGFDPDAVAQVWGLKGIGIAAKLQWRIFIPIVLKGELVSWTTRSISDSPVGRYRSASVDQESLNHKTLLYGEHLVRHAVIVHEGPTDVWRTGPGAVAVMGTGYSTAQVYRLSRYPLRVICFDSEPQAQKRARELADALRVFPGSTQVATLSTGKDVAEADEDEVEELRGLIQ